MAWTYLCDVASLPDGGLQELEAGGVRLLVARAGDEVFAYPARCPHMEEPLANGMCDGRIITCAFHLWQWDMRTGEAVGEEAEMDLLFYPSKVEEGRLYVDVSTELDYD